MNYQLPPTTEDVLRMMSELPAYECVLDNTCKDEKQYVSGHFDTLRDARLIAKVISNGVVQEDDSWKRAAEAVVFAAYESGNDRCTVGDGGRSYGAWQVQGLSKDVACDPAREFPLWLSAVKRSESLCVDNPESERLAALASGSCDRGRRKVRGRENFAIELARKVQES
jgi:hypothetical protein